MTAPSGRLPKLRDAGALLAAAFFHRLGNRRPIGVDLAAPFLVAVAPGR
jgi:hypothetical protein